MIALLTLLLACLAQTAAPDTTCRQAAEVVVWRDLPTPCDVRPPQVLTALGISAPACDDAGGTYEGRGVCRDLDY